MRNKVTVQVDSYDEPSKPSLRVHSHWNSPDFVVLDFGDKTVTVHAYDLIDAVKAATINR
jgi:hypothetical protein